MMAEMLAAQLVSVHSLPDEGAPDISESLLAWIQYPATVRLL